MAKTFTMEFDARHWEAGAARFRGQWKGIAEPKIRKAMDEAFRLSDAQVHVITGFLKASGHVDVESDGDEVVGVLAYEAPYAVFEFGRGGEHDAFTPAILSIGDEFLEAMMNSGEDAISTWR